MAELKTYVLSKLFWDPSLNDTALIEGFMHGYCNKTLSRIACCPSR